MADEFSELLDNTRRYLAQQKELLGNILYTGDGATAAVPDAHLAEQPAIEPKIQPAKKVLQAPPPAGEDWINAKSLASLNQQIHDCLKCSLGSTRTTFVFGTGNIAADLMFIGEAPGADEDAQGEPFVGKAGQLLNKIIEAVDMKREDVYICNILKCRPPNNRPPEPEETETCTPYLMKQIDLVKPKFIILLGRTAAQWLLKTKESLGNLRGKVHDYHGIKLIVTYHPAALLRNPEWKRPTWDDMKMFKKLYDETGHGKAKKST